MPKDRTILLIEEDQQLRRSIAARFRRDGGFTVHEAASLGEAGTQGINSNLYFDAAVVDTILPDGNGREYCRNLRERGILSSAHPG